jgi:hypothetical protein
VHVGDQSVLLFLLDVRELWNLVGLRLLNDTVLLGTRRLAHFKVIDLHIRDDLRLTLHLGRFVALELLQLIVLPLVSEGDHRAEENVEWLLQNIVLLQPLAVDCCLALPPLVEEVDVLAFEDLVP